MRILIGNSLYFVSAGPEKYMFNVSSLLEEKGHKTIPFSVKHSKNEPTEYSKYFIEPIGGDAKVYYKEYKKNFRTLGQLLSRTFYSSKAKKAIMHEIDSENPDIVYLLPFINKLSPSIIDGAKKKNKRVIVRMSDFFLLCPRFDFLYKNEVCDKCLKKGLISAIPRKCVQNSYPATFVRVLSMYFHRLIGVYDRVDKFVCPSGFLARLLIDNGFDSKKVVHIPTFIDASEIKPKYEGEYVLYFGRISREKGLDVLLRAFSKYASGTQKLYIVGDCSNEEGSRLMKIVDEEKIEGVSFLGFKKGNEIADIIVNCKFVVIPARWFDNMPNVLLEAYAYGKPVIASNIGSFTELIDDGKTGFLVKPNDINDLADKMKMLDKPDVLKELGLNARKKVEEEFNKELHYKRLMELFKPEACKD